MTPLQNSHQKSSLPCLTYFENISGEIQSPLLKLPDELKLRILSFMEPQAVAKSRLICKVWSKCAMDAQLWKDFLTKVFPNWVIPPNTDFREAFIHFTTNLTHGRSISETLGPYLGMGSCFKVHGTIAYSKNKPSGIKAIDLRTRQTVYTIEEPSGDISALAIDERRMLLYASYRYQGFSTIKVWDIKNKKHLEDLALDIQDHITHFAVEGDVLCAAALGGPIKAWNLKTLQCEKSFSRPSNNSFPTLSGENLGIPDHYLSSPFLKFLHRKPSVGSLALRNGDLYIGYSELEAITVWNLATGSSKELLSPTRSSCYWRNGSEGILSLCIIGHILFISWVSSGTIGFINLRDELKKETSLKDGLVAVDLEPFLSDGITDDNIETYLNQRFQLAVSGEILYSLSCNVVKAWVFSPQVTLSNRPCSPCTV